MIFSYLNPVLAFGIDAFADSAAKAGVDGLLLTDVIEDEAAESPRCWLQRASTLFRL